MYKLYLDKQETFKCSIKISGASTSRAKIRLALESKDCNLYFPGSILNSEAIVVIPPLQRYYETGSTGKIRLEVIVDNTYITPWESMFETCTTVNVTTTDISRILNTPDLPTVQLDKVKIAELLKKR